ncbi:hypothetical protein Tco_0369372 [Tanacetum coccineum]
MVENLNPQSTPQVLPSFEENTSLVTYPDEVEETLGTPIEVEPLDKTPLEDLGLNTFNHDIPLISMEVPSFDEPEPQSQPLPNCPSLDVSLEDEGGLEPPIKPHTPDSFRMKVRIFQISHEEGKNEHENGKKTRKAKAEMTIFQHNESQSTPQFLPSFEKNTPPVTYLDEVEETLGTPIEVEPLDETPLEDLGLNTCNHDIPLISMEVPSFDEPEPQSQPLPNCPSLDVSLEDEGRPEPPIKPHTPVIFRMKVVYKSTINTPPSPHVASFHPMDTYCYYHPCIDDPKKHYGFKPGLLGQSGSLGVDF